MIWITNRSTEENDLEVLRDVSDSNDSENGVAAERTAGLSIFEGLTRAQRTNVITGLRDQIGVA